MGRDLPLRQEWPRGRVVLRRWPAQGFTPLASAQCPLRAGAAGCPTGCRPERSAVLRDQSRDRPLRTRVRLGSVLMRYGSRRQTLKRGRRRLFAF